MIITIDGPVASGKSTVAQLIAKHFGFYYINSGLLFRALAYLLKNYCHYTDQQLKNIQQHDVQLLLDAADFKYVCGSGLDIAIFFKNKNITSFLKSVEIDGLSSMISKQKLVRDALIVMQREYAKKYDLVVDGRDTGSVVFPDAEYKFFVTASNKVRASRWQKDQKKRGNSFSQKEALDVIVQRDEQDSNRKIAPLIVPKDGLIIDTSDLKIEEVLVKIIASIDKKRALT